MLYIQDINATEKLKFRAPVLSKNSRKNVAAVQLFARLVEGAPTFCNKPQIRLKNLADAYLKLMWINLSINQWWKRPEVIWGQWSIDKKEIFRVGRIETFASDHYF